jgi:hypothetical protein
MKHALVRYNRLVNDRLNPMLTNQADIADSRFDEWIELSRREKENIKEYLLRKSISVKKRKALELMIQQYQAEIIQLLDVVFEDKQKNKSEPLGRLLDAILSDLEEVLSHIESRYGQYFNLDQKVPASYLAVAQADLRERKKVLKKFTSEVAINQRIVKVVFAPLSNFLRQGKVSYAQLIYVKDLIADMEEWWKDTEIKPDQRNFLELLFYLNFNAARVADVIVEQIENLINASEDRNAKLEHLTECLKHCNQAQVKPGVSFRRHLPSIQEHVSRWIEEEIYCMEKEQRLLAVGPAILDQPIAEEEKLCVKLSVEVLALIGRAAKDSGVVLNKHLKGMFRTIVKFVKTPNSENLSSYSMLKKSYRAERNAKRAAIELLHELIKRISGY